MSTEEPTKIQPKKIASKQWVLLGTILGAGFVGFVWLIVEYILPFTAFTKAIQNIQFGQWTFAFLILIGAILTIAVPILLTSSFAIPRKKGPGVEKLLRDPHVRRTILRFEIGGITAGAIAVVFAVWGIYQANYQSRLAEQALRDQRISSAWQILAQKGSGSTGKNYALNILANETNEQLVGLQLGCTIPLRTENGIQSCRLPIHIEKIQIGAIGNKETIIAKSNFSYANFSNVILKNVFLNDVVFTNTNFSKTTFVSSEVSGSNFSGSHLSGVSFRDVALFEVSFAKAKFNGTIENSTLTNVSFKDMPFNSWSIDSSDNLIIKNSALYQVDFTNVEFYQNQLRFLDILNLQKSKLKKKRPKLRMIGAAYSPQRSFNISGAKFCPHDENDTIEICSGTGENQKCTKKTGCWKDASQEFFKYAWYFKNNPPKEIEKLPFKVKLRIGCPEEKGQKDERNYDSLDCRGGKRFPIQDLIKSQFSSPEN